MLFCYNPISCYTITYFIILDVLYYSYYCVILALLEKVLNRSIVHC